MKPQASATKTKNSASPRRRRKASKTPPEPPRYRDPHVRKALQYVDDVLTGKTPACAYVIQACQRQRDDLERFANDELYLFSEEKAGHVCRFIERLPHIKGPKAKAKELIVLEPWQCFILTTVFGWIRKDTGGRRFSSAYIEVPRGNGKSALSSGVALYCLAADGEEGAEVYSAATTRGQARIVFDVARRMLLRRKDFARTLGIQINKKDMQQLATNSTFEPLSREADNQDGANLHCGIIDELHAHKTRETYDVLETAAGKRLSSLLFVITTAGKNTAGICYEVRGYILKVLAKTAVDEARFGVVYTLDLEPHEVTLQTPAGPVKVQRPADDKYQLASWIKANPNWGISVMPDKVASNARKAMSTPSARANFETKHLDIWCNADMAAFDLAAWDRCADITLSEDDLEALALVLGLDLASKIDIAAKAKLFYRDLPRAPRTAAEITKQPEQEEPETSADEPEAKEPADAEPDKTKPADDPDLERHYYLFLDAYLPEAAVEESDNAQYSGWAEEGRIKTTPGDVIDFLAIEQDVIADRDRFIGLQEVAYDPWQAQPSANNLADEALTMVVMRPTLQNFSPAMKEFDALMRCGRLHHDGNPLMRWMVANVVTKEDQHGNVFPRKDKDENKIDGVVAALMALGRAMVLQESPYSGTRGLLRV